jgi:hypothetical protein
VILESITNGCVRCSVEAGEVLPIRQALDVAAAYERPVTFDFNNDIFIIHPNGEVRQIINGRWNLLSSPYGIAPYGIRGAHDEQPVAPLEIPKSFSKPKPVCIPNGKRKLIL